MKYLQEKIHEWTYFYIKKSLKETVNIIQHNNITYAVNIFSEV